MDAKLTLSFNKEVVQKAKPYAASNNISLSRLVELLLTKATSKDYKTLEDYPISEWVSMVAEGSIKYQRARKGSDKSLKQEFFESRK